MSRKMFFLISRLGRSATKMSKKTNENKTKQKVKQVPRYWTSIRYFTELFSVIAGVYRQHLCVVSHLFAIKSSCVRLIAWKVNIEKVHGKYSL